MLNLEPYRLESGKLQSFAWPGGYPIYYLTADGGVLCPNCANRNLELIESAISEPGTDKQWEVIAADVNYEDSGLYCDDCYGQIESAYGDD